MTEGTADTPQFTAILYRHVGQLISCVKACAHLDFDECSECERAVAYAETTLKLIDAYAETDAILKMKEMCDLEEKEKPDDRGD